MPLWKYRQAARVLRGGGVIAYPTEGMFGLGCDPLDFAAVTRICQLKRRSFAQGVILIAACLEQLEWFFATLDEACWARVNYLEPGPITWLLPASPNTPSWLTGNHATIAVRVSEHPVVRGLCIAFGGAIVSTSANRAGLMPAVNTMLVYKRFAGEVDAVVGGRVNSALGSSEIRDAVTGKVVRPAGRAASG